MITDISFINKFPYWPSFDMPYPVLPDGWKWVKHHEFGMVVINEIERLSDAMAITETQWRKHISGERLLPESFGKLEMHQSVAPHIFDLIDWWPSNDSLGVKPMPEITSYWRWRKTNTGWVIDNDYVALTEDDWEKHRKPAIAVPVTAASMLQSALDHMEDRAKTYDAPGGERSMGKTVTAFNAITGLNLTEEQGWLFMETLKQVRSQQGNYRADNYEDLVAYAALRGECAARERGNK